jgi:hypothetical protein
MDANLFLLTFDVHWSNTGSAGKDLFSQVIGVAPEALARRASRYPLGFAPKDYLIALNLLRQDQTIEPWANASLNQVSITHGQF